MSQQLSPAAEILRQEIKTLITEASSGKPKSGENASNYYEQDANGNRTYDGFLYERKVSLLMEAMELGKVQITYLLWVCFYLPIPRGGDGVWHISHNQGPSSTSSSVCGLCHYPKTQPSLRLILRALVSARP